MRSLSGRQLQWLLVVLAAAWFGSFVVFPGFFQYFAVEHYGPWFVDSAAILASNDAVARGWDPLRPNPLDLFNRPHVYSHWWLGLHHFGLTRDDTIGFGFLMVVVFLAAALTRLRPQEPRELAWYCAVLGSPGVLLAFNRANNDLLVFTVLAPVVPCLLDDRRLVRIFAVGLVTVAAGLKFYPAVAGVVLLAVGGGTLRESRERILLAVLGLALVGFNLVRDFELIRQLAPQAFGLTTFGARNLPTSLGFADIYGTGFIVIFFSVVIVTAWRWQALGSWSIAPENQAVWLTFVLGAAMLTGCFVAGTNFGYRWVFAIWLAPLLWRLPRDKGAPPAVRRLTGVTAGLLVFSLWADAGASLVIGRLFRGAGPDVVLLAADRFFYAEQPLIWAFFGCLTVFLTHHCRLGLRGLLGLKNGF
jgi:hypothetical protein